MHANQRKTRCAQDSAAAAAAASKSRPVLRDRGFYITPTLSSHYMVSSGDSTEKVPTTSLSVPICSLASLAARLGADRARAHLHARVYSSAYTAIRLCTTE